MAAQYTLKVCKRVQHFLKDFGVLIAHIIIVLQISYQVFIGCVDYLTLFPFVIFGLLF